MSNDKVYEIIYDKIVTLIEEKGLLPWQKPWTGTEPANFTNKKNYRGINPWILSLQGFSCPYWLTFKQAEKLGGKVRKGERGTPVVFWKWIDKEDQETGETKRFPILRYYTVFNVEQCDNIKWEPEKTTKKNGKIKKCEKVIREFKGKPKIQHGKSGAFYQPKTDQIGMPNKGNFINSEEYYSTLFHEAIHSTGHKSRLNRHEQENCSHNFGSHSYSKEELCAEFGAAFLCALTGIENKTIDNSAAYLKSWLKKLKENKKWLVQAAAQAQKACDHILGITFNED